MKQFAFEPEKHVQDDHLGLECVIYGWVPVQADGRLAGHALYFRARGCNWLFTLCLNADIDASLLTETVENGFFKNGELEGFTITGEYGANSDAGYMPYSDAERLIRECSKQFLAIDRHSSV